MNRIYPILLAFLMLTLVVSPLAAATGRSGQFMETLLFVNLAIAAFGSSAGVARKRVLLIVAGAAALRVASYFVDSDAATAAAAILWIALAATAAFQAFRYAISARSVDADHICAALSVYMLLGHFFGFAYWKLESVWPGSFSLSEGARAAGAFDLPAAIYFSFVSIATVGFGDIVPCQPLSRGLTVTEAVAGQFYMVVLVARLVGLYSSRAARREK